MDPIQKSAAVIHYHEIALKGKNRAFFEKTLMANIERMMEKKIGVRRISGRLLAEIAGGPGQQKQKEILSRVFGIKNFAFARIAPAEISVISEAAASFFKKPYPASFRIEASRAEKKYPFTSQDLMEKAGAFVQQKTGIKVDLKNPKRVIFIEVAENAAFIYDQKFSGPGGLPVGTAGRVAALISSGFDSPVAALKIMKRGAEPALIHFHSYPRTSRESLENAEKLAGVLSRYSPQPLKLYLIPFLEIQKAIVKRAPTAFLTILYRRWMLKIAEMIAEKINAKALVTGDSIGQVASQTLDNILAVSEAVSLPILRPLAGYDKEEIIAEARRLGTYEISALPYGDCCSLFADASPKTRARLAEVQKIEAPLKEELEKLAQKALAQEELKIIMLS
ncbi:MAG: tRNA 4-thiouridine(8) synthase ThiI [Candidatus Niyogibacteria bacterium]|nr:tRNA 4-thiouridine(8) synthase ThiI [Candidatus Niyogibacteria bacterium]